MERPARFVAIIRVLRACGTCDAQTLAERLGTSSRTLYRDAALLAGAGVPIQGTRGTGYRFDDAAAVLTVDLSIHDALALLDALAAGRIGALPDARGPLDALARRVERRLPPVVRDARGDDDGPSPPCGR